MEHIGIHIEILNTFKERLDLCIECMDNRFSDESSTTSLFTPIGIISKQAVAYTQSLNSNFAVDENVMHCPIKEFLSHTSLYRMQLDDLKQSTVDATTNEHDSRSIIEVS